MSSPNSLTLLICSLSLYLFLAVARKEFVVETSDDSYYTLRLSSLLPSSICNPSNRGGKKRGSMEVVHKHGPCSKFNKDKVNFLTVEETIAQDQSRVSSLMARLTTNKDKQDILDSKTTIPAKSGRTIGTGNYIVTIGLGTPKKDLTLIFDTGSDLTWVQCQPCARKCYNQQEPIFDPSMSTTYTNISCTSTECSELPSATGFEPDCVDSSTCVYGIKYGDGSFTIGFFGKEKLTISSEDIVDNFYFGCGQNNQGLFNGSAGLLGLGQDKLSIVSQAANLYGNVFSYCLPTSSSIGYLTFGNSGISSNVKYTPFTTIGGSLYGLELVALYVGGTKLTISPMVFKTSGTIIDSGTVITRLPNTAYSALRDEFKAQMTDYPLTKPFAIFDTCYDLSKFETINVPKIGVLWGGDTFVDVPLSGIFIVLDPSQVCLAFAGNDNDDDLGIWGNTQQKTQGVVYDLGARKVGFASEGCD